MADRFAGVTPGDPEVPPGDRQWDGLSWWRRAALRATGLYTAYVIRRTGRQVSKMVQKMQRGDTLSGL